MHPVLLQGFACPLGMYTVMHGSVLLGAMIHILILAQTQHPSCNIAQETAVAPPSPLVVIVPLAVNRLLTSRSCPWRSTVSTTSVAGSVTLLQPVCSQAMPAQVCTSGAHLQSLTAAPSRLVLTQCELSPAVSCCCVPGLCE